MARGGYRRPPVRTAPAGPGRFSKRTDAQQPIRTPSLAGSPDMQYGDVQRLTDAERMVPLPQSPSQQAGPPPVRTGPPIPVPDYLFSGPSTRPNEPVTTGLPVGPGPGPEALQASPVTPDEREQVLQFLVSQFNNQDAAQMLADMRAYAQQQAVQTPAAMAAPAEAGLPQPV